MEKLQDRYYYLMLIGNMLSHLVVIVPYIIAQNIFNGVVLSLAIAIIITVVRNSMIIYVCNEFKDFTLVEMSSVVFGKILGNLCVVLNAGISLFLGFLTMRSLIEVVHEYMLPTTPSWFLAALILILPLLTMFHSPNSHLHFICFFTIILSAYALLIILLPLKEVNYNYVKLVMARSMGKPCFVNIATFTFFLGSASQVYLFNPSFNRLNSKIANLIFIFVGIPLAIVCVLIPVGIWGPWALQKVLLVWTATSDTVTLDLSPIERGLFILLPGILMMISLNILSYCFVGFEFLRKIVKNKKGSNILIILVVFIFYLGIILIKEPLVLFKLNLYGVIIWFIYSSIIIIPLYILTKIRRKV